MNNRPKLLRSGLVPRLFFAFVALAAFAVQAKAQSLGSAETFAVLGASTVTNGGASQISGSVGVSPGTAITGFPPGIITNGALHPGDATATQAHADFATAYADFAALVAPPDNNLSGTDLGGKTLFPGVYRYDTSANSAGALTLDAQNEIAKVETRTDNPALTDMLTETEYSDYADHGEIATDVKSPGHIVRKQGGHPVLDIQVKMLDANNPYLVFPVPEIVKKAAAH